MSSCSTVIKFYLGEESRLVIDDLWSKNESIFKDSYETALNIVRDYVKNKEELNGAESAIKFFRQTADVIDNNIIAFIGDRGTGKSSCMLSVANMLKNISDARDEVEKEISKKCENGFEILETIDPSFFEEKTNVLEIVLGRMFSNFRKKCENRCETRIEDFEKRKTEVFKAFQMVKESFVHTNGCQVNEDDCIDGLMKLTASVDLRDSFKTLIEKYLEFLKKDYLVISVDDLDLNTQYAYKMAEQIRKYLRQEKVLVLIALKMEQLEYAVQLQLETQYKEIKDKASLDIPAMVSKYILKLIPNNNRIYLPNIHLWANAQINVYRETNDENIACERKGKKWTLLNKSPRKDISGQDVYEKNQSNQTLKYYILSLIFSKTRYLFYHTANSLSPILPRNLREMRFLIELLENMKNYSECRNENNKTVFREYFVTTWAANNLSQKQIVFLKKLFSIAEPEIVNKFVLDNIKGMFSEKIGSFINENEEIKNVYAEGNKAYNISLGDVLGVIDVLKNSFANVDDERFLFAIETFYSMKLYEYYDSMSQLNCDDDLNNGDVIKRKSILGQYGDYVKLVGGNLINPKIKPINDYQPECYYRNLNIRSLNELWEDFVQAPDEEQSLLKLQMIEFFTLCISVRGKINNNYRNLAEVAFDSSLGNAQIWAVYDLMSMFFNLPRIDSQYKRVSEYLKNMNPKVNVSFDDITKKNEKSLYNQIKNYCQKRDYSENKFMSWVSIRNIEVLNDFMQSLGNRWINRGYDDYATLQTILEDMEKYEVLTYDYSEGKYYSITFKFVEVIRKLFENDKFKELFEDVKFEEPELSPIVVSHENGILKEINSTQAMALMKKENSSGVYRFILKYNPGLKKNPQFMNYWKTIKDGLLMPQDVDTAKKLYSQIIDGYLKKLDSAHE